MAFNKIKNLLKENIGLHADSVGLSSIERAISHRMSHIGLDSESNYYSLLKKDHKEFAELIEEVVVPETWFFRNKAPFEALRECVSNMGYLDSSTATQNPLKILSLPCATGEEPYSIAMSLVNAGLSVRDFHIDGVDVSKRALAKARRAIYGKHSFREDGVDIQDKFFKKTRSGFQVLPEIRNSVSFEKGNIISEGVFLSNEYYDIIFCRNLLIYFQRETQKIVLDKLYLMLKSGGYLFVGHAEAAQVNTKYFEKVDIPKSFSYQKVINGGGEKLIKGAGSVDKLKEIYDQLVEVTRKDSLLSNKIRSPNTATAPRKKIDVKQRDPLAKVEKLIDQGRYDDATSVCEKVLDIDPENADVYYYLGLISNLCGSHGGAESLLKKAIYLSPNHQKALSLSAMLAEKRGDNENADYFRRREIKARDRNKR